MKPTTARIIYHGKAHKRRTKMGRAAIAKKLRQMRVYRTPEQISRTLAAHKRGDV